MTKKFERLYDLQDCLRSGLQSIPIARHVTFKHDPSGYKLNALVVSEEVIQPSYEGDLIYLEVGSRHSMLNVVGLVEQPQTRLQKLFRKKPEVYPTIISSISMYDRNENRDICTIHVPVDEVITLAYPGTLEDLAQRSDVTLLGSKTL